MAAKRQLPLPKRFNVATTEAAYSTLRALNARTGLSNNYLLTILLEQFERIVDQQRLGEALAEFTAEYGAPATGPSMARQQGRP